MNVLLTGITGFVGNRLAEVLLEDSNIELSALVRGSYKRNRVKTISFSDSVVDTDYCLGTLTPNVIVHSAGVAHARSPDNSPHPKEYRRVNVDFTVNLARQGALAGVSRFIFISSIGVNGTSNSYPFTESSEPEPSDAYSQSKWEAEQALWQVQRDTGMEIVVIRPPLVYGQNAPGNFGKLLHWVDKGIPLPLGAVRNQRSLVAVGNLVDLIITCIDHPAAANQVFLAGDGQDLSTTELLRGVANAMGRPSRLIPVPASLLMLGATLLGKKAVAQRLLGSLQVDISKARALLGWEPPISVEEGLRRCFEPQVK